MIPPKIKNSVSHRLSAGINIFFNISVKDKNRLKEFIKAELETIKEYHLKSKKIK